jgi:hypothetical protein
MCRVLNTNGADTIGVDLPPQGLFYSLALSLTGLDSNYFFTQ